MSPIELKRLQAELQRVISARVDQELRIEEHKERIKDHEENIERLKETIVIQQAKETELTQKITDSGK